MAHKRKKARKSRKTGTAKQRAARARMSRAAKHCKGRSKGAFRTCIREQLKK